jgi:hypothetical protein
LRELTLDARLCFTLMRCFRLGALSRCLRLFGLSTSDRSSLAQAPKLALRPGTTRSVSAP